MPIQENLGDIKINNEVVKTIASCALSEVEGVIPLAGKMSPVENISKLTKGVSVEIKENQTEISIEINVEYGIDIYKAAHQLQKAIKNAVETMTGLIVSRVNVSVREIMLDAQPRRLGADAPGDLTPLAGNE